MKKRNLRDVNEGEGGAAAGAGDAGGAVAGGEAGEAVPMQDCPSLSNAAIDSEKVLGKCDHKNGYMGKKCFHIPKKIMPTLHRWEICNGGSKRKKGKNGKDKKYAYEKGMKVITSYKDLVEALGDATQTSFVFNIPHAKISEICDQESNDNLRFQKNQFMKLIDSNDVEFVGLFDKGSKQCLAMAALQYGLASAGQLPDDCYINEIQSFKKGYGKALIKRILETQEKVWLCANPEAPKTLVDFYRQPDFGMREHIVAKSIWKNGAPAHFFYTDDCDEVALTEFIDANYTQPDINEDEFDSMMTAMNSRAGDSAHEDVQNDDISNYDIDEFREVQADDITQSDYVYFCKDFGENRRKHIYAINVSSMNFDDSLKFNDVIMSDKPLSFKEIVEQFWPKLPNGYGIGTKSFLEAGREYSSKIAAAKDTLLKTGSIEEMKKAAMIPFPVIELAYGNTSCDMIKVTPLENEFNDMTARKIPAALVVSDTDPELKFNKFASDKLYFNQMIGESKNHITGKASVIQQKKQSLKSVTTSKPASIKKIPLKRDATDATQISQSFKHVKEVSRPLSSKMMSKLSQQEKKHFRKAPETKRFIKPRLSIKQIALSKDEIAYAENLDGAVVTTQTDDNCDKFQIGDIVKSSQMKDKTFKVIARCVITSAVDHPLLKELTDSQIEILSKCDKMSVLTLAEMN